MSRADDHGDQPRAMIHRRILDVATSKPDASVPAIADEVSGASPSLVERVLDEYGDPARSDDGSSDVGTAPGASEATGDAEKAAQSSEDQHTETQEPMEKNETGQQTNGTAISSVSLSDKQRRTLREVFERPEASQGEIAESLDVTRATVSRRLNSIPGFEWDNRAAVSRSVFGAETEEGTVGSSKTKTEETTDRDDSGGYAEDGEHADEDGGETTGTDERPDEADQRDDTGDVSTAADPGESIDELRRRVAALESSAPSKPNDGTGEDVVATVSLSPELAHKVLQVCLSSDQITEEEERELVYSLIAE